MLCMFSLKINYAMPREKNQRLLFKPLESRTSRDESEFCDVSDSYKSKDLENERETAEEIQRETHGKYNATIDGADKSWAQKNQ